MDKNLNKNWSPLICIALALTTFAVFYQVHKFDFVDYDDPGYVYENQNIQAGITLETVKWAFNIGYEGNWHPLTWLSHMLDWQLFGASAGGHHITNLIFHIANTLLLFIVLKQMTNALWRSAFVAALFALHPLHVESVAWVSERKDVLSTFFLFLTMWAYTRYVRQPKIRRYLVIVIFFAFGLMAKPMLVTLPFMLLLLDYWPLERFGKQKFFYLIWEKVPLFVLSAVSSFITFLAQRSGDAVVSFMLFPLKFRICNAIISYVKYIYKMVWPAKLAVFYPHSAQNISLLYTAISAAALLVITILIFRSAKKHRYLVTGWFWYLGTLVPVIGLAQVGSQALADRYTYITLTGLFIIITWGLPQLLEKWPHRKIVLWVSSLIVLFTLALCSYFQTRYWKDGITIYQRTLNVTKDNYLIRTFIADMYFKQGRYDESVRYNAEAVQLRPNSAVAANRLGWSLSAAGRLDEAIGFYQKALSIDPRFALANTNLGSALVAKGNFAQAVRYFKAALETADTPHIRSELGYALLNLGRFKEAVIEYQKVLLAQPRNTVVHNDLGVIFSQQGDFEQAILHFNKALQIDPDYAAAKNNLDTALAEKQQTQK